VCIPVQQNILNVENKKDKIFVDEVKTLWKEKTLWGNQTQDIYYTVDKASYKTLVLIYLWCSSHTFNSNTKPIVNASQPSLLPKGVFNGFIYLMADP